MDEPTSQLCAYYDWRIDASVVSNWWENHPNEAVLARESMCTCEFCASTLQEQPLPCQPLSYRDIPRRLSVRRCARCGWWYISSTHTRASVGPAGENTNCIEHGVAISRRYDVSALDIPLTDLARFLSKRPDHLAHVNPTVFETLMVDCLRESLGPAEVIHTGRTGDGGIDIKMVLTDTETYLVQVKRRANLNRPEGVRVVRELNGVLFREGLAKGMVISTAKRFTRAAQEERIVKTPTAHPYHVDLRTFDDIVGMLRLKARHPYEPWTTFLERTGWYHVPEL